MVRGVSLSIADAVFVDYKIAMTRVLRHLQASEAQDICRIGNYASRNPGGR